MPLRAHRRAFPLALPLLFLLAAGAPRAAAAPPALAPAGTGGLAEVERGLARLDQHRRLLIVGAHPDDEDTALLALVTRGQGGEAAYLSLTRGEGGQNLIGEELGEALGVLRSEELLAARRLDGGRQLFTRAYDFGYTESLEETFTRWPREALLVDVVRAIRRFRPQVVVAVFPPTARAGHGQHQAAGVLAEEAFRRAGEAEAFPELLAEGLAPWQPALLYREAWFDPAAATLELPTAELDPLSGHTVYQLAMASRSLHRSQSMGAMQSLAARPVRLTYLESSSAEPRAEEQHAAPPAAAAEAAPSAGPRPSTVPAGDVPAEGLFAGIDTRLVALGALAPEAARDTLQAHLERAAGLVAETRRELAPSRLADAAPRLAAVLAELRAARALAPPGSALDALLAEKAEAAAAALAAAAGLALDATADRAAVIPGDRLDVAVSLWNGGPYRVRVAGLRLEQRSAREAPPPPVFRPGWEPPEEASPPPPPPFNLPGALAAGALYSEQVAVPIDERTLPSMPYFLARPRPADWYDLALLPPELLGEPFEPPLLELVADLELMPPGAAAEPAAAPETAEGEPAAAPWGAERVEPEREPVATASPASGTLLELRREVVALSRDLASGERRLPLRVVPRLEVSLTTSLLVWPLDDRRPRRLGVELRAHGGRAETAEASAPAPAAAAAGAAVPYEGVLEIAVPDGWPEIEPVPFRVTPGERVELEIVVRPPEELVAGRSRLQVAARERRWVAPEDLPPAPAPPPAAIEPALAPETGNGSAAPDAVASAPEAPLEWWTSYDTAFPLVEYEHVRPRPVPIAAHAVISAFPLELPALRAVAYVRGAADYVPEALLGIGLPLELVTPEELARHDLGRYDAIVVGPRAYESSPSLARVSARLDEYVRRGGLLVVQYQRWEYFQQGLPPVPMSMERRGAGRTTDETAPVRVLAPDHLALSAPNPIGASDWEGWVQERGLYYPASWDPLVTPLLAMADPGREELAGALLVAPHGRGTFVYTGLAFFRQLPAGVPGAYRLFANLLALARPHVEEEDLPWDEP